MKRLLILLLIFTYYYSFSQKIQEVKLQEQEITSTVLSQNIIMYTKQYLVLSEDYQEDKTIKLEVFKYLKKPESDVMDISDFYNIHWGKSDFQFLFSAMDRNNPNRGLNIFSDNNSTITSFRNERKFTIKQLSQEDYTPVSLLIENLYIEYKYVVIGKEEKIGDYIEEDGYKKLNIDYLLRRKKLNSDITGTYDDSQGRIRVVELTDNDIIFSLSFGAFGYIEGLSHMENKIITFEENEYGECKIQINFRNGFVELKNIKGDGASDCGFGRGVYISKEKQKYKKISNDIPNLREDR